VWKQTDAGAAHLSSVGGGTTTVHHVRPSRYDENVREYNFDGLVGPTHNYAGLSRGNLASESHAGAASNPRAAALQGLAKMQLLAALGVGQAVLPPASRPDIGTLRRLGYRGTDADVLANAASGDGHVLRLCSSASSMWTANAATIAPSSDTEDGRLHLTVANLTAMFHRSLEPKDSTAVFSAIFADETRFVVHPSLPGSAHFADEGAANHLRLATEQAVVHVMAWGRSGSDTPHGGGAFPKRQSREASLAVARLNALHTTLVLPWQQDGRGIDCGAFHSDVLAVGNESFLMMHELAFVHYRDLVLELKKRLGPAFSCAIAYETELTATEAVGSYPFNSQIVTLPDRSMAIVAPAEARDSERARRFLDRVVVGDNPVRAVHYVDVNGSMSNGGGPACLRLRIVLTDQERSAIRARVFLDDALYMDLVHWVERHYRDRLSGSDLADPNLLIEIYTALDELTSLLKLGSIYDFQRP
jgi:succinylarginine dihydrolase